MIVVMVMKGAHGGREVWSVEVIESVEIRNVF